MNIYIYEETTSTNDLGMQPSFRNGDVIWAERQSAGRGQRGNKWLDGYGLNATFSIVLEPDFLEAKEQFKISRATALALCATLREFGIEEDLKIKWTNDIYIGNKKVAGVLIENRLVENKIGRSVVGIGININQTEFDSSLPNPTSMSIAAGQRFNRESIVRSMQRNLMSRIELLKRGEDIAAEYHSLLYRLNEEHRFRVLAEKLDSELTEVSATIVGVEEHGALILKGVDGTTSNYQFREVEFIIDGRDKIE